MNTRRAFVLGAVSAGVLPAESARFADRLRFFLDGPVPADYVRWNPFLQPPPDLSQLPPNLEIHVRCVFPFENRDTLDTLVYLKLPNGSAPISRILMAVEEVSISDAVVPGDRRTLALFGKVTGNPVPSPFGLIIGKPMAIGGAFDAPGSSTRFEFFGGMVAGSHATFAPEAFGSLDIKTPWNSF